MIIKKIGLSLFALLVITSQTAYAATIWRCPNNPQQTYKPKKYPEWIIVYLVNKSSMDPTRAIIPQWRKIRKINSNLPPRYMCKRYTDEIRTRMERLFGRDLNGSMSCHDYILKEEFGIDFPTSGPSWKEKQRLPTILKSNEIKREYLSNCQENMWGLLTLYSIDLEEGNLWSNYYLLEISKHQILR